MASCKKYYFKSQKVEFEEDLFHEFKGHRNLTKDELPRISIENGFRQPISRNLCGFLNTGLGGIVHLGIIDDGTVYGIRFTKYQKDHLRLALHDIFQRFNPPVDEEMYTVRFVPVINIQDLPTFKDPDTLVHDTDARRDEPHTLRTPVYCWCEAEALALHNSGKLAQEYVVEIEILPWNANWKLSVTPDTPIHPLFLNEEGNCFYRRMGSLQQLSLSDVIELAEADTYLYHKNKMADKV